MGTYARHRLFWIVLLGIVLYVVLDAVAQVLPPYYSPISQAESDLAVGPYGYVMAVNFINRGAFSLVFLYALARTANAGEFGPPAAERGFRTGMYLFGVWAIGAILLAFFPTDVPAVPMSWHGAVHLVVAALAFLGGAFGALRISMRFGENGALKPAKAPAFALAVLSVVLLLVGLGTISGPVGGLTERLFLGSVLLWEGVVSVSLARTRVGGQIGGPDAAGRPA